MIWLNEHLDGIVTQEQEAEFQSVNLVDDHTETSAVFNEPYISDSDLSGEEKPGASTSFRYSKPVRPPQPVAG